MIADNICEISTLKEPALGLKIPRFCSPPPPSTLVSTCFEFRNGCGWRPDDFLVRQGYCSPFVIIFLWETCKPFSASALSSSNPVGNHGLSDCLPLGYSSWNESLPYSWASEFVVCIWRHWVGLRCDLAESRVLLQAGFELTKASCCF